MALTERMKALLGPFVLRRLKGEVARQLAPKQQRLELVPLTPVQAALYADAVASLRKSADAAGVFLLGIACPDGLSVEQTLGCRGYIMN